LWINAAANCKRNAAKLPAQYIEQEVLRKIFNFNLFDFVMFKISYYFLK